MHITSHALTHPGLRRESNEDSVAARPNLGLWVVCDGMGGHAAGEVASRVAAESIEAFVEATDRVDSRVFTWPFGFDPELGTDGTRLVSAFKLANHAIDTRVHDDPSLSGMATTAVALLLRDGDWRDATGDIPGSAVRSPGPLGPGNLPGSQGPGLRTEGYIPALLAHVGDSRAYLWREGVLSRLTRDHSWVEEQTALGSLTEQDARTHPWRNLVTRALTGGGDPEPDVTPLALERGDRVLLCSDGLTTPVADEVIASVMGKGTRGDVEGVCQTLVDAANAGGGPDNITVVVIEVQ
jgi:protein phosphatase